MKHDLPVAPHVVDLISELQNAGYEAYIVGGAIRDLLLGRKPKDFDISTSATPEEVRAVFGRRIARIIGKRFRLVHVEYSGELFEVSTFRRAPTRTAANSKKELPENLILSDNSFGTAEEDAWRRDFTVNALFYDPVNSELLDYTGQGIDDIRNRVVRAIGDPKLRFEEDPVRMLRALKLIGQYDFTMDAATENALFSELELIRVAAPSRLALELEKILSSAYGDKHFQAFHDYGLLPYFLPELNAAWDTPHGDYALNLLNERNCRVREGLYRNSVSLAMAALALPFVELECGGKPGDLWNPGPDSTAAIRGVLDRLFKPQTMMNRMTMSAERADSAVAFPGRKGETASDRGEVLSSCPGADAAPAVGCGGGYGRGREAVAGGGSAPPHFRGEARRCRKIPAPSPSPRPAEREREIAGGIEGWDGARRFSGCCRCWRPAACWKPGKACSKFPEPESRSLTEAGFRMRRS